MSDTEKNKLRSLAVVTALGMGTGCDTPPQEAANPSTTAHADTSTTANASAADEVPAVTASTTSTSPPERTDAEVPPDRGNKGWNNGGARG